MKCRLHKTDSGSALVVCPADNSLHQLAADAATLNGGVDGNGSDPENHRPLIEAVTSKNSAIGLGNHAVEMRVGNKPREQADGDFRRGKVAWKSVGLVNGGEGVETDLPAGCGVGRHGLPDENFRL
jgi:hypothetical protein